MTPNELARLAAAVNVIRPDWPAASLQTYLAGHAHRPLRDVAVAIVWVATDADTKTPRRMDEAGPWWAASRTAETPRAVNDCPRHADGDVAVGVRIDLATGGSECAGCWADAREAPDSTPTFTRRPPPAAVDRARAELRRETPVVAT